MDRIIFIVNEEKCSVGHEVDSDTSLIDYLRNHLNQRGTKYMCKEGGCGACIVAVTVEDPHRRTFSVNSCLVSVTSCHGWEVTTIEGIGGRGKGYHPIQKTLAEYNGTQCGYCSPGFVMSMYSRGEIQYLQYDIYGDHGHTVTDTIASLVMIAIKNCYDNRRWQYKIYVVLTDTASNIFARAPGMLEDISMTEYIMEQIRVSYELQLDPVDVRLNNLDPNAPIVRELALQLLKDGEYSKRKEETENFNKLDRWKKRGLRVAFINYPTPLLADYSVLIMSVFHGDGTVHGGIEIGQGINTAVVQALAYTLNIPIDKVRCKAPNEATSPNCLTTGTSITTKSICTGAIKCCQILLDRLSTIRETLNNPTWEALIDAAFTAGINLQTSYKVTNNDLETFRCAGVTLTEVELDILTGEHEVLRVDIIEDVGLSVNPELDIGQIEGAFVMGLGYWTHEELIFDKDTGELFTDRTWYYHVPLTKDIPIDFRVQLRRNSFNPVGTLGAKIVSEPPICMAVSVAFALREAIASSREDTGYPRNKWFNVDGPFTLQANVLAADAKLEEFLFN